MDSAKVIRVQKESNAYNAWVCGEYEIINWWLKIINISSSADKKSHDRVGVWISDRIY